MDVFWISLHSMSFRDLGFSWPCSPLHIIFIFLLESWFCGYSCFNRLKYAIFALASTGLVEEVFDCFQQLWGRIIRRVGTCGAQCWWRQPLLQQVGLPSNWPSSRFWTQGGHPSTVSWTPIMILMMISMVPVGLVVPKLKLKKQSSE